MKNNDYFVFKNAPKLKVTENWASGVLVIFPVSYRYNGGIILDSEGKPGEVEDDLSEWYQGFKVPKPKIPNGFELVSIGVGLQMNSCPPMATRYLKPLNPEKINMSKIKKNFKRKNNECIRYNQRTSRFCEK